MSVARSLKGFGLGVGALAALQLFLSSDRGTRVFGYAVTWPTRALESWLDPSRPLIPDLRQSAAAGDGKGGGKGGTDPCADLWGPAKVLCWQGHALDLTYPTPTSLPPATASLT